MDNVTFKDIIDSLKETNRANEALLLAMVKYQREIAGEDDDKREKQLGDLNEVAGDILNAVTGSSTNSSFDLAPVVDSLSNITTILQKSLEEQALLRKVTEGSVEFDKSIAGYRNTSGREVQSVVSGKTALKGGIIDFETARDYVSGQGKRAIEANELKLKPVEFKQPAMPGTVTQQSVGKPARDTVKSKNQEGLTLGNPMDFARELIGRFQDIGKFVVGNNSEKQRKLEVNAEADNIQSPQEIMADAAKESVKTNEELLITNKQSTEELKLIRLALAPEIKEGEETRPDASKKVVDKLDEVIEAINNISVGGGLELPGLPDRKVPSKPTGRSRPGKKPSVGRGLGSRAMGALRAAGPAFMGAGIMAAVLSPYAMAAEEKEKIRENPNAPEYKDNPYAMVVRGEAKTEAQAGEINRQKTQKQYRRNEVEEFVKSDLTDQELTQEFGTDRQGLKKWLSENTNKGAMYQAPVQSSIQPKQVTGVTPEAAAAARTESAVVDPRRIDTGAAIKTTSADNTDLTRQISATNNTVAPIVSTSINNSSTNKFIPMKPTPRIEGGSYLDKYLQRVSVF